MTSPPLPRSVVILAVNLAPLLVSLGCGSGGIAAAPPTGTRSYLLAQTGMQL
jgi:hypothetical protein